MCASACVARYCYTKMHYMYICIEKWHRDKLVIPFRTHAGFLDNEVFLLFVSTCTGESLVPLFGKTH